MVLKYDLIYEILIFSIWNNFRLISETSTEVIAVLRCTNPVLIVVRNRTQCRGNIDYGRLVRAVEIVAMLSTYHDGYYSS